MNQLILAKGGVSAVTPEKRLMLPLPVAGLMSDQDGYEVGRLYSEIDHMAVQMGSKLASPFMTLSFMALLVIPSPKIGDQCLFDAAKFQKASPIYLAAGPIP